MITFNEANQVRLALKMRLSRFCWYVASRVESLNDTYVVYIDVSKINGFVRKQIPSLVDGVKVKIDLERSK